MIGLLINEELPGQMAGICGHYPIPHLPTDDPIAINIIFSAVIGGVQCQLRAN